MPSHSQLLDIALNNLPVGVCMFDADGRVILINRAFRQMYRVKEEDISAGTPLVDYLRMGAKDGNVTQDPESLANHIMDFMARGETLIEVHAYGDGRHARITNMPVADGSFVSTHEDITDLVADFRLTS